MYFFVHYCNLKPFIGSDKTVTFSHILLKVSMCPVFYHGESMVDQTDIVIICVHAKTLSIIS